MDQVKRRRRRSDRSHAIYMATCLTTGEQYVGLTVCSGLSPLRAINERWKRHVGRALTQDKDWKLCEAIRQHGPETFRLDLLEKVRGKAEAHARERELTKYHGASLNTA